MPNKSQVFHRRLRLSHHDAARKWRLHRSFTLSVNVWASVVPIHHLYSSIYSMLNPSLANTVHLSSASTSGNETLQCFAFENVNKLGKELPLFPLNPSKQLQGMKYLDIKWTKK